MDISVLIAQVSSAVSYYTANRPVLDGIGALLIVGLTSLIKDRAYKKFFLLTLTAAQEAALLTLNAEAQRKTYEDQIYSGTPAWVKRIISQKDAETILEEVYQTFITMKVQEQDKVVIKPAPAPGALPAQESLEQGRNI